MRHDGDSLIRTIRGEGYRSPPATDETLMAGWKSASLTTRLGVVMLAALLLATLGNFIVTFSGPPPYPRPMPIEELLPVLAKAGPCRALPRPPGSNAAARSSCRSRAKCPCRPPPRGSTISCPIATGACNFRWSAAR
jgi:hypothetical protein